jgi:hypothetical protein
MLACGENVNDCYRSYMRERQVETVARQILNARYIETASGDFMPQQTPELFIVTVLPFLKES